MQVSLGVVEFADCAVVHPQPAIMTEWMAVGALHRRTGRRPDVGEQQRRTDLACNLPQVPVVPRRFDALEQCRLDALAVPADPEAVAVGCRGAHAGVEALVDDRVLRSEQQLFGEDRVSGVRHPSTHALSEAPPKRRRHHPSWGILARCPGAALITPPGDAAHCCDAPSA